MKRWDLENCFSKQWEFKLRISFIFREKIKLQRNPKKPKKTPTSKPPPKIKKGEKKGGGEVGGEGKNETPTDLCRKDVISGNAVTSVIPDSKCCCQRCLSSSKRKRISSSWRKDFLHREERFYRLKWLQNLKSCTWNNVREQWVNCAESHEIPSQERDSFKALGHQLRLLHSNTDNQFFLLCTRRLRKAKICIFQAFLTIPNKPQNKSAGQRLNTPQQFCLLSWLLLRVPSGN